jgi:hypothetical protein
VSHVANVEIEEVVAAAMELVPRFSSTLVGLAPVPAYSPSCCARSFMHERHQGRRRRSATGLHDIELDGPRANSGDSIGRSAPVIDNAPVERRDSSRSGTSRARSTVLCSQKNGNAASASGNAIALSVRAQPSGCPSSGSAEHQHSSELRPPSIIPRARWGTRSLHYSTVKVPTMPAAACPGMVQMYS